MHPRCAKNARAMDRSVYINAILHACCRLCPPGRGMVKPSSDDSQAQTTAELLSQFSFSDRQHTGNKQAAVDTRVKRPLKADKNRCWVRG